MVYPFMLFLTWRENTNGRSFTIHLWLTIFLAFITVFLLPSSHGVSLMPTPTFFRLQHRYSRKEGSTQRNGGKGMREDYFQHLRSHDRSRHGRMLMDAASFPLGGIADPNIAGLYFTEVKLGTPPSNYYVQVDTGSDLLWLNCASCRTCPRSTDLGVRLMLYDPESSSSSSTLSCGDTFCNLAPSSNCGIGQVCGYELRYGDGSSSEGYFVKDIIQLDLVIGNRTTKSANATVAFGCGTIQRGQLQQQDQALDGIMGFGQSNMSVIQQLVAQGKTPGVFAHCLEGESRGGGILVIGDVQAPGIVYTPIVQNQVHYNVNLKSITVNGEELQIVQSTYSIGETTSTIIDSGTTLAYLREPVYQPLINAILLSGPKDISFVPWQDMTCVVFSGSLNKAFPTVTFNFDGEKASMVVNPDDYFIQAQTNIENLWCIGFQSPTQNNLDLTIIGDLILKDKLVVYDLNKQQIGWVNYNCSSSVSILSSTGKAQRIVASAIGSTSGSNSIASFKTGMIWVILLLLILPIWF